ncbi:MAG: succinylglutamate desuccinylase/aspartoacylase family protein [Gammaproteobacteria bacterium]
MSTPTPVFSDIEFERDGRQIGQLNLPHSPHEDAWGVLPIPIAVLKNGDGPTVLLEGGNHGDEYEGPIILGRLIRELDVGHLNGRLIVLPAVNTPAAVAGQRTSPIDGLNFNRSFPGDPRGSATQQIAHYVHDVLFPMADAFVDLHSGGSSLDILPSAIVQPASDPEHTRRNTEAVLAFGAPLAVVLDNLGETRTAVAAAVNAGLVTIGTELGRGGSVSPDALRIGERGVRRALAHFGVLAGTEQDDSQAPVHIVRVPGQEGYVYAPAAGVFEPFHDKGEAVEAGEAAGHVHFLDDPGREPVPAHYKISGTLYCRRQPGRVERGNCVAVVVRDQIAG